MCFKQSKVDADATQQLAAQLAVLTGQFEAAIARSEFPGPLEDMAHQLKRLFAAALDGRLCHRLCGERIPLARAIRRSKSNLLMLKDRYLLEVLAHPDIKFKAELLTRDVVRACLDFCDLKLAGLRTVDFARRTRTRVLRCR